MSSLKRFRNEFIVADSWNVPSHRLGRTKNRFGCSLLLFPAGGVSRLFLLFVRKRRQNASGFPDFDIAQGHRDLLDEGLHECRVQRLRLMSLDDVFDDLVRQLDEVLLRARLCRDEGVKLLGRST